MRTLPNIIVTGTPGVGKTTTCIQLVSSSSSPLHHLSINALVKDRQCHEGYDDDLKSYIVDEDKLLDEVEKDLELGESENGESTGSGGWLIDWHACDLFPKAWIDLVVVLRCEKTEVLWDRLMARCVRSTSAKTRSSYFHPLISLHLHTFGVAIDVDSLQELFGLETTREPRRGDFWCLGRGGPRSL